MNQIQKHVRRKKYIKDIWRFFFFCLLVNLSGTSDDENIAPAWHNETTMTISETPDKTKKRPQRKTKKALIQEEEEEDDEETKIYKQRLRNVKNFFINPL